MTEHVGLSLPPCSELEAARLERGWTIDDLARRSGYAPNTVLRCLHGKNVHLVTFLCIADALGFEFVMARKPAA